MNGREAIKIALDALEYHQEQTRPIQKTQETIAALRQALAQPEQEPTTTIETVCALLRQAHDVLSLSSLPPTKPWVGLTDEEVAIYGNQFNGIQLVKEIEGILKERNNG